MFTYQINGQGDTITADEERLTYAEGLELEKQTGLGVGRYLQDLNAGSTTASACLFWIGAVKHAAAAGGLSFRDAARELTFEAFTETLDIASTYTTVCRPKEPQAADPTRVEPDGSTAPTSPATSGPQPAESPSPTPEPATSDSSPSTSASAPGTGTASPSPTSGS